METLWLLVVAVCHLLLASDHLMEPASCSHLAHYDQAISSSSFGEPVFRLEPPNVINLANTKGATIVCLVSGSPRPTISWYLSSLGIDLSQQQQQEQQASSSSSTLFGGGSGDLSLMRTNQPVGNVTNLRQILQNGAAIRLLPFKESEFRQDIHSTEYRCVASNQMATIHSRSVLVRPVMSGEDSTEVRVNDEFVGLGSVAVFKCRLVGSASSGAGAAEFSHLLEWFTSDGIQMGAGESSKGNKFVAFKSGELHVVGVDMGDLQRTYGCRLRNSLTHRVLSSSGLAQLVVTDSIDPVAGAGQSAATPGESRQGVAAAAVRFQQQQQVPIRPQVVHSISQLIAMDSLQQLQLQQQQQQHYHHQQQQLQRHRLHATQLDPSAGSSYHQSYYPSPAPTDSPEPIEWRLLLPCAVRAPASPGGYELRWLYQPPGRRPASSAAGGPRAIPLAQWAAVNSFGLLNLTELQPGANSSSTFGRRTVPGQLAQAASRASAWQQDAARPPPSATTAQQQQSLPTSRFVVGPTYLALEWPQRAHSGRYTCQLVDVASGESRTVCDTNVIIRQPMRLKIEANFGGGGGSDAGDFSAAAAARRQSAEAAGSAAGVEGNEAQVAGPASSASSWIRRAADWIGWSAAERANNEALAARRRGRRAAAPEAGSPSNPVLEEDARRIRVRGAASIEAPPIVRVGRRLQLDCLAFGYPIESVKWFRNGQPINTQSSSDFQVEITTSAPAADSAELAGAKSASQSAPAASNAGQQQSAEPQAAAPSELQQRQPSLISSLVIRQLQPRDVGLQMFECFSSSSLGDQTRAGQPVLVVEQRQLEWARSVCPLRPALLLLAANSSEAARASAEPSGAGYDYDYESPEAAGSQLDDNSAPSADWLAASPSAQGRQRAEALFRRHNPVQRALLLEAEPVELVCPLPPSPASPSAAAFRRRHGAQGQPVRVDWRRWTAQQQQAAAAGSGDQQPARQEAAAGASKQQQMAESQARNFNQLFSGDSHFVINGSSLQIRSPSKRHDEALYVCRQSSALAHLAGGESSAGAGRASDNAERQSAAAFGAGSAQDEFLAGGELAELHQSSLASAASSAASCSALVAAALFQVQSAPKQQFGAAASSSGLLAAPMSSISIRIVAKPKIDPFEFSRNLEEGMRAVAVCAVISGQSPVDITWFKDGQLLLADEQMSIDQANGFSSTLTFHRIRPGHSGLYTCVAANAFAAANHTSRLIVNEAPYFIEPPKNTRAILNKNVLVNCRAGGQPNPQIRWRKMVPVGGSLGSNNKLVAPPGGATNKQLDGMYAGNTGGQLEGSLAFGQGDFQQGSQMAAAAATAAETNSAHLQANKFEFKIITSNSHIQILENGSMIIKDVELSDASRYVCQAFNGINPSLSEVIDLVVLSPAQFEVNYETVSVKRDSVIKFNCAPKGDQPMRIEWHKEGNLLVASSSSGANQEAAAAAAKQHQSKYSEIAYFAAPTNATSGADQQQRQRHNSLILQHPAAGVTNTQVGGPMPPAGSSNAALGPIGEGLKSSELFINYADRGDTGAFVCVARNAYGMDKLTYRLVVQEPPDVPQGVGVQNVQSSSLKLSWTSPFDGNLPLTHFVIEYRKVYSPTSARPQQQSAGEQQQQQQPRSEWLRLVVSTSKLASDPISAAATTEQQQLQQLNSMILGSQQAAAGTPTGSSAAAGAAPAAPPAAAVYSIVLRQLSAKSTYHIRVAAVNAIGQGGFSAHLTVLTAEEPPSSRPNDLRAQPISSSSIKVLWRGPAILDEQAPIAGYYISHRKLAAAGPLVVGANSKDALEMALGAGPGDGSQQPGPVGAAAASALGWLATSSISAANISFEQQVFGAGQAGAVISGQQQQQLLQRGSPGGASLVLAGANYEYQLGQLEKNTKYEVRVQPFNSMGVGPASDTIGQTLKFDRPSQPNLKLVAARRQSFELKWSISDNQPLMGFSLFYKCEDDDWQEIQLGILYHYVIENLRCGNKYQIYLSAFNVVGRSDPSDVLSVRTEGTVPIAPEKSQFIRSNISEAVLDMSGWQSGGCPISSFSVQFKRLHDSNWFVPYEGATRQDKTTTIADLSPATWYKLLVTARNEAGSTNAEYLFATLNLNGEQIAPNFPLDSQEAAGGWLMGGRAGGAGGGAGGRSLLGSLSQLLFSPGQESGADGSDGHLLLPMSCILVLLLTSLASYVYYSRTAARTASSAGGSSSQLSASAAAAGGTDKGSHRHGANDNNNANHHHHHHHHRQNGALLADSLARSPSLLLMNRLQGASGCDSASTTLARATASVLTKNQDEKQLIQSSHHLHHLMNSHTLPLDAGGDTPTPRRHAQQGNQQLGAGGQSSTTMFDSFLGSAAVQSFVGATGAGTLRAGNQRGPLGMKLLAPGNIFGGAASGKPNSCSLPAGSCTNSSSVSTHSTNCFDGASSQASSSENSNLSGGGGGGGAKAKLQLIDESSMISGTIDESLEDANHLQQQRQLADSAASISPARQLYASFRPSGGHVDIVNQQQESTNSAADQQCGQQLLDNANLGLNFFANCSPQMADQQQQQPTFQGRLYSSPNQRILSTSFASAADLLQRQQQQQQQQMHYQQQQRFQPDPGGSQRQEPIYQRLDKFQGYGLSTCKQQFATMSQQQAKSLRFGNHFSVDDDASKAATLHRQHFQPQPPALLDEQQFLAGFYPAPQFQQHQQLGGQARAQLGCQSAGCSSYEQAHNDSSEMSDPNQSHLGSLCNQQQQQQPNF